MWNDNPTTFENNDNSLVENPKLSFLLVISRNHEGFF
ncbi:hypothetical protein C8N47_12161 [Mangrovibacterium marinum]|uniref:Uncharacterized protein n=1 Tax=Mangrovibacterium marinum TaxID=1639118 RepID=A0A2T5BYA1_9BACT|nr:hypothetical protein C8N47_12161 [Mangrovibacterium marinum]